MKELSLHILDLVQNSIAAKSTLIEIKILENTKDDKMIISIKDNGIGMEKDFAEKIKDPFITSRSSRKVGLGVSLLYAASRRCDGDLKISSEKDRGTEVAATFRLSHIDRAPLGNMADTMASLLICSEDIDYVYIHIYNDKEFIFDTREVKKILGGDLPLSDAEIVSWIRSFIADGLKNLYGGAI